MRMILGPRRKCRCFFVFRFVDGVELRCIRGMKTVYIQRKTEDSSEDMEVVRKDVDFFVDGTNGRKECGLGELADILQT